MCKILSFKGNSVDLNTDFEFIIDNVASGKKYDCGAAGLTILPEREKLVNFSIPYFTSKQYVIIERGRLKADGVSDGEEYILWSSLKGLKIGVQTDTTADIYVGDEIDGGSLKATGAKKNQYYSSQLAVDALGTQVDAVVADQLPAEYMTRANDEIVCFPLYFDESTATEEQYAICVNKNLPDLLNAINEVLTGLCQRGCDKGYIYGRRSNSRGFLSRGIFQKPQIGCS
ncbi:MAG: transporter substrate-binding domain-containing protein [Clostridia bacterium]|nr:transporter substrate-binding domain-containing protein [Clostridia bacterium]